MKTKIDKDKVIFIAVIIAILLLVILLIMGSYNSKHLEKFTTQTVAPVNESKLLDFPAVPSRDVEKSGKSYILSDGNDIGVYHTSIDGKDGYYYFWNGTYQDSFSGLVASGDVTLAVRNGKVNPKENNLVSYEQSVHYIRNGVFQEAFNGKANVDGDLYTVTNGIVSDLPASSIDGTVYHTEHFSIVK